MIGPLLVLALQLAVPAPLPPPLPPPPPPVTLEAIGQQKLPAKGCAAFVWNIANRKLVAMATAQPPQLRLSIEGKIVDIAQVAQRGEGGLGFSGSTDYAGGDVIATLEMKVVARQSLAQGAQVTDAVLRVERRGGDSLIVPVAGLIGCR